MYVVFIYGPAASGKYTIGSIVSKRMNIPLYHNHLAVDLASSLFDFGTPGFAQLREEVWLASFAAATKADQSFIFTFCPEATVDPQLINRLEQFVQDAGGRIYFIELCCSESETLNRLDSTSRAQFGKLQDRALYQQIKNDGGFDFPALGKRAFTIDTETATPEDAAQAIEQVVTIAEVNRAT